MPLLSAVFNAFLFQWRTNSALYHYTIKNTLSAKTHKQRIVSTRFLCLITIKKMKGKRSCIKKSGLLKVNPKMFCREHPAVIPLWNRWKIFKPFLYQIRIVISIEILYFIIFHNERKSHCKNLYKTFLQQE